MKKNPWDLSPVCDLSFGLLASESESESDRSGYTFLSFIINTEPFGRALLGVVVFSSGGNPPSHVLLLMRAIDCFAITSLSLSCLRVV